MKNVAVVCARGLGDALLSMVVSHNLSLSRVRVATFSSILCELNDWFPNHTILPYPKKEAFQEMFSAYDTIIAADHSLLARNDDFGSRLIVFKESRFDKSISMADNLQKLCKTLLKLPYCEKRNGMVIPKGLSWQRYPQRVVIHPTSSEETKNWPAEKYIKLGTELEKQGYAPHFCLSPAEREKWVGKVAEEQLPIFPTVHELACFVFESGAMIGNDSGVGHLASALSIPTLSLFARKSYAQLWRPGWGEGLIATPPAVLPGARLKQKYWKQLLSVRMVVRAFAKMGVER